MCLSSARGVAGIYLGIKVSDLCNFMFRLGRAHIEHAQQSTVNGITVHKVDFMVQMVIQ